jgi:predicted DNA-binding protein (MmcQ/YjbR family)
MVRRDRLRIKLCRGAPCTILKGMDAERTRAFLLKLPHVVETGRETRQWGDKLVFRVGAQADGGKMFAQFDFTEDGRAVLSFAAGPDRLREILERDGVVPAPYRARIHWIALEHWNVFRRTELEELLRRAHALTYAKLPKRTRELLAASDEAQSLHTTL